MPVSTSGKPSRMKVGDLACEKLCTHKLSVHAPKEYVSAGDFRLSPTQVAAIDEAGKVGAESGFGKYWSW